MSQSHTGCNFCFRHVKTFFVMLKKISGVNSDKILDIAINEAKEICEEDVKFCENIGLNGLKIIEEIYNRKKKYS